MPKALCRQAKELVRSVIAYMEKERGNGGPLIPLTAVRERAANALGISLSCVSTVSAAVKNNELLRSPKRKKPRQKPVRDVDDFTKVAIRNVIYEFYESRRHVSRETLLQILREREIFMGGLSTLGKILHDIGFRYKKDDPRRGLMEMQYVAVRRVEFLKAYMRNLNSNHPSEFVYLDETWIFENGTIGHSWQDNDRRSVKKTKMDGKRQIVLHAGNKHGFIPGASLVFSSKTKNSDYHGEMNKENFLHWFEYQLLHNLEEPSVIVMDNASYHSILQNKAPTSASTKDEIKRWLQEQNVTFDDNLLKVQLLQLVKENKPPKTYVADTLAQKYGHTVLRLPPYHCIFNPIEKIWGITKTYFNKHMGRDGYGTEKALAMWKEALSTVTPETWANCIKNAEKEIRRWWDREVGFDQEDNGPVIIELGDSDDSSFSTDLSD